MKTIIIAALMAAAAAVGAVAGETPQNALKGAAIQAKFPGFAIYGRTPSDNVFQVRFLPDGKLRGQTHKDSDKGRWWVKDDTLCRNWTDWSYRMGKEKQCFYVVIEKDRVKYYAEDGELYRDWGTAPHR